MKASEFKPGVKFAHINNPKYVYIIKDQVGNQDNRLIYIESHHTDDGFREWDVNSANVRYVNAKSVAIYTSVGRLILDVTLKLRDLMIVK